MPPIKRKKSSFTPAAPLTGSEKVAIIQSGADRLTDINNIVQQVAQPDISYQEKYMPGFGNLFANTNNCENATSTINITQDKLYAFPLVIGNTKYLDGLRVEVTASTPLSFFRTGIYKAGANYSVEPAGLVNGTDVEISGATTGIKSANFGGSIELKAGLYFLAFTSNLPLTMRAFLQSSQPRVIGNASIATFISYTQYIYNLTYAPLPLTFPAVTTAQKFSGQVVAYLMSVFA